MVRFWISWPRRSCLTRKVKPSVHFPSGGEGRIGGCAELPRRERTAPSGSSLQLALARLFSGIRCGMEAETIPTAIEINTFRQPEEAVASAQRSLSIPMLTKRWTRAPWRGCEVPRPFFDFEIFLWHHW